MSYEEFSILLAKAAGADALVKQTLEEFEKDNVNFKTLSTSDFAKEVKRFLDSLVSKYRTTATSFSSLNSFVQNLIRWMNKVTSEVKSISDCEAPLAPGETTFDDLAGQEQVKDDIRKSYIYPFQYPNLFKTQSKGILLYGPPGTGKTAITRAATAELPEAAFYAPSPGQLKGKYEGETEKNISKVFECASQTIQDPSTPYKFAIIFFDEFDSIAGSRGDDAGMRRSVNALLQAMDGIKSRKGVSVIAATNNPWDIDSAILRRFKSRVFVDLPDDVARQWLIRKSLVDNYSLPNLHTARVIESKTFSGEIVEWNNEFLENMKNFGSGLCTRSVSGGLFGGAKEESSLLTIDGIDDIVKNTGISSKAQAIKNKIVGGEYVDPDDIEDEDPDLKFGYSASDVSKMMGIAIDDAAGRALLGGFRTMRIAGKDPFIAVPMDEATHVALEGVEKGPGVKVMTPDQRKRAYNFSLCSGDVETAIEKYPSTISSKEYIRLLNYKYLGYSP